MKIHEILNKRWMIEIIHHHTNISKPTLTKLKSRYNVSASIKIRLYKYLVRNDYIDSKEVKLLNLFSECTREKE